jgi:phytoene desaturase
MRQETEVLIIGSGMGGMCAAALLAAEGLKTIVVESLPRIGGRCSTIDYQGFKCTTGVIGPEMGGVLEGIFRKVGARFDVRPAGPPHYLVGGQVCELPPKGGLKMLLETASKSPGEKEKVLKAFSRALAWMEPSGALNLKDWLMQYTRDVNILNVFQTMVSATMIVNADEVTAGEYFRFVKGLGGIRHFGFCPRGSIALPEALAETVRSREGDLWVGAPVEAILSENGVVKGARVSWKGKDIEIKARVVISNAGPRKTLRLAGKENFDRGYLMEMEQNVRPAPVFCFQIAAQEPLIDQDYLMVTGARRINALFQPTGLCPELAPPGRHLLFAGATPQSSLPPLNAKKEMELCLKDLRDLIPGFEKRAEILLAGSYHGDWPGMHAWPGKDLPQKTPIVNLYNVGDGVKPPGTTGLPAAAASAMRVVGDIRASL